MKLLITLSFALLIFSGFALATPVSSFAATNNNNSYTHFFVNWKNLVLNFHNNKDNNKNDNNKKDNNKNNNNPKDDNDCGKHLEKNECHVSVPEFGTIPGAVALLSSGGSFLFLKKRYN